MKHTLLIFFALVFLYSCKAQNGDPKLNNQATDKHESTKNISEADRVKMALVIPALDALSYQLEKVGYDTEVLNKINKYLKENSVSEFLEKNEIVKEVEKVIESGNNKRSKPIDKKTRFDQQDVFDNF